MKKLLSRIFAVLAVGAGATIALGLLSGVLVYVIWGSVILHENREDMVGNLCDEEHIWIYTLFCVVLVACGLCCGIGLCNQAVCSRNEQGKYQPGMFPIITATVGLGMFLWGVLQYLLITKNCAEQFKSTGKLGELWDFFYASIILQAIGAGFQVLFFVILCLLPDKVREDLDADGNPINSSDIEDSPEFLSSFQPKFFARLWTTENKQPILPSTMPILTSSEHVVGLSPLPADEETPLLSL